MQNIIPDTAPPAWATRSRIDAEAVFHSGDVFEIPTIGDGSDQAGTITVTPTRIDSLSVTGAGLQVDVGPVWVFVGDHRLDVPGAARLQRALAALLTDIEAGRA